ncbi:hypothetical protein OQA88_3261 [Cercophora sp. LCS_1]
MAKDKTVTKRKRTDNVNSQQAPKRRQGPSPPSKAGLACPFAKKNPHIYFDCLTFKFDSRRAGDLKQHLRRKHLHRYCARCGEAFDYDQEEEWAAHTRERACQEGIRVKPDLDEDQWERITKKGDPTGRKVDHIERWHNIWSILFPGEPRHENPSSNPFIDCVVHVISSFQSSNALISGGEHVKAILAQLVDHTRLLDADAHDPGDESESVRELIGQGEGKVMSGAIAGGASVELAVHREGMHDLRDIGPPQEQPSAELAMIGATSFGLPLSWETWPLFGFYEADPSVDFDVMSGLTMENLFVGYEGGTMA